MQPAIKLLFLLTKKELHDELVSKQTLVALFMFNLLFITLLSSGLQIALLNDLSNIMLFAPFLWCAFIASSSLATSKLSEYDARYRFDYIYKILKAPFELIYLAKFIATYFFLSLSLIILLFLAAIFLNINLTLSLLVVGLLIIFGYTALLVLFSTTTHTSPLKNLILPIVIIPITFPLFFAALELSNTIMLGDALELSNIWISLALALDLIYFVAGVNLYQFMSRS
jgi:heme exporter protein B